MCFSIRPFRHFPMQCAVTYIAGSFQGQCIVWNLSLSGLRFSRDLPMRPGETLFLTVTLPNEQCIDVPEPVVRSSNGLEFAVEKLVFERDIVSRLGAHIERSSQGF